MTKWQQKYRVDWDATDGRNGGAQQSVWAMLLEMERCNGKAKEADQGALALVLDLANAFERVSLPVVWAWGNSLQLPKEDLASAVRVLRAPEACTVTIITAILPGSKWSCLLLRSVLQNALNDVTKKLPSAEVEGFCE